MRHKKERENTTESDLIQTEGNKKGWGSMSTRSSQHAHFISQVLTTILLAEWPSMDARYLPTCCTPDLILVKNYFTKILFM